MKLLNAISILVVLSGFSCFSFAADAPKYLADRHAAKQIPCEACHGKGTPNDQIQMDNCLKCHGGTYEKLAAQTVDFSHYFRWLFAKFRDYSLSS